MFTRSTQNGLWAVACFKTRLPDLASSTGKHAHRAGERKLCSFVSPSSLCQGYTIAITCGTLPSLHLFERIQKTRPIVQFYRVCYLHLTFGPGDHLLTLLRIEAYSNIFTRDPSATKCEAHTRQLNSTSSQGNRPCGFEYPGSDCGATSETSQPHLQPATAPWPSITKHSYKLGDSQR